MSSTPPRSVRWLQDQSWGRKLLLWCVFTFFLSLLAMHYPWLLATIGVALGVVVLWWFAVAPRAQRCVFCGEKQTLLLPRPNARERAWWEPLHKDDVMFVCEPHLQSYLIMFAKLSD